MLLYIGYSFQMYFCSKTNDSSCPVSGEVILRQIIWEKVTLIYKYSTGIILIIFMQS